MAAYKLLDFSDIVIAIMEELKIQSTDSTTKNRIKRAVNMMYLDEVIPAARWWWLYGHTTVTHAAFYTAGSCVVTPLSSSVTLSIAPASTDGASGSFLNYYFSVDQTNEIYKVTAHTALATTLTLDRPYNGTLNATATFKIWRDEIDMPTDFRESIDVWHDQMGAPLEAKGLQEFRKLVGRQPKIEGRPSYYSTYDFKDPSPLTDEFESDRFRVIKVFPAISQYSTILKVDYIKEAAPLENDGDEPLMPVEDRIVLFYGGLSLAWGSIGRNPEEAARNRSLFESKLSRMMGKVQDTLDKPRLEPESVYVATMRGNRIKGVSRRGASAFSGSQSTYNAPSYLTNVTINGATVSGDITVNPGILIDGRDISVDGAALDAHLVDPTDAHAASAIAVTPAGNLAATEVQTALIELQGDIDALSTLADGKIYVGDASNVASEVTPTGDVTISNAGVTAITSGVIVNSDINASAAIAYSKLNLATSIVNADVSATAAIDASKIADGTVSSAEFQFINSLTSNAQTQINAKAPSASPTFTGTVTTPVTASRALVTGAASELVAATTTATEIGYVNGVTSAIQTQINTKAPSASPTFTGTVTTPVTASRALVTGASSELAVATTTATEIGYVNGVTSAIQTQINTKAPSAGPTFSGTITTPLTASRALVTGASSELAVSTATATEVGYLSGVTSSIQTQLNSAAVNPMDAAGQMIYGGTAGAPTKVVAGSSGQVLRSGGTGSPAWSTATFPATATGTGKVLVADGTNWVASTPTFPNASATSGKFIRSDGTNWIASTPTLPTSAGTSGKVLQSDGTNYVESTATYPATVSANAILYGSGSNVVGGSSLITATSTNFFVNTTTVRNSGVTSSDFNGNTQGGIGLNDTASTNGAVFIAFMTGGTFRGSITNNNNTAVAYGTTSDYRLKKDVEGITDALDKVMKLKPCYFTWKEDDFKSSGFIAHELQEVLPNSVVGEKDAINPDGSIKPQQVDKSSLTEFLVAAIQELKLEIDALKIELAEARESKSNA